MQTRCSKCLASIATAPPALAVIFPVLTFPTFGLLVALKIICSSDYFVISGEWYTTYVLLTTDQKTANMTASE